MAHDGDAALERLGVNDYDVVVLDRDLPAVHGGEICRTLVDARSVVGILMLTAACEVADRVDGLALGADDYLGKPSTGPSTVSGGSRATRRTSCGPQSPSTARRSRSP